MNEKDTQQLKSDRHGENITKRLIFYIYEIIKI